MAQAQKPNRGVIKTENAILFIAVALAIGFIGGVMFSAHRTSARFPTDNPRPAMDERQQATEATLKKQVQDTPKDSEAWIHLGHFYFDMQKPEKAIEAYETALAIDEAHPDVWTDLGVVYRRSGNPEKAVACFDKALALKPDHEIAMFNKGIVLMHDMQDLDGALKSWQSLLKINPQARTPDGMLIKDMVTGLQKAIENQGE